mmetsp:Transcript_52790/g.150473  ORF Transcript_52790/g.150473 Transcript_52790/m.150473 type:complete len:372 (-) Transcript_52790:12-1127(-)
MLVSCCARMVGQDPEQAPHGISKEVQRCAISGLHLSCLLFQRDDPQLGMALDHAESVLLALSRDARPSEVDQEHVCLRIVTKYPSENTAGNIFLSATAYPELHAVVEQVVSWVHLGDSTQVRWRQRACRRGANAHHRAWHASCLQPLCQANDGVPLISSYLPHATRPILRPGLVGVAAMRVDAREQGVRCPVDPLGEGDGLGPVRVDAVAMVAAVDHEADPPRPPLRRGRPREDRLRQRGRVDHQVERLQAPRELAGLAQLVRRDWHGVDDVVEAAGREELDLGQGRADDAPLAPAGRQPGALQRLVSLDVWPHPHSEACSPAAHGLCVGRGLLEVHQAARRPQQLHVHGILAGFLCIWLARFFHCSNSPA